ncbi:MAG: MBL fold metallo-hydrolase [Chitinophagaceae bacterium]|nr:MAG: MBL fold metallo-hydrolase [Chitinophagaceae bacterium]
MTSFSSGDDGMISHDVYYYTNQIVNVAMIGVTGRPWILVDTGMPTCGAEILKVAEARFGERKPEYILLTHGHFDHVGGIVHLLQKWDVPVYAHPKEFPYLNGTLAYPEPDTSVEGGILAKISSIYPHQPIDISPYLKPLPEDHSLPGFEDWKWLPTPGHSPGHISLFRDSDRILISGDAVVTVRQDSFYKVLFQIEEVNGPPRYLTTDWAAARESVQTLAQLNPEILLSGHGGAMIGEKMRRELADLARNFNEKALPKHGRYI